MKIETRKEGPVVVVSPSGRLDGAGAPVLEAVLHDVAGSAGGRAVLDCAGIACISSEGLLAILVGAKTCLLEGGELEVAALRPDCRAVMEASGLLSILKYRATVEAAVAGAARIRPPQSGAATEIGERHEGSAIVLSLTGRLDGNSAAALTERIFAIVERGATRIVLDCEGLAYINSTGLRALLIAAKICREAHGRFVLAAVSAQCRSVMEMSGFLSVIEHRETRDAALAALA